MSYIGAQYGAGAAADGFPLAIVGIDSGEKKEKGENFDLCRSSMEGWYQKGGSEFNYFAGLDVSVKETSICIVDDMGRIVREVKVASEPEALLTVLANPAYHFKRIGLEAGPGDQVYCDIVHSSERIATTKSSVGVELDCLNAALSNVRARRADRRTEHLQFRR